ncbi:MAG: UbiX family flavin prenyltransferase [Bacteroidota bacterium]|nr:UbiX family flavin prenyltransferase [Bacteroidota bacterium]
MTLPRHNIIIAVTGASGAIYSKLLLDKLVTLKLQTEKVALVLSDNAKIIWKDELENQKYADYPFKEYDHKDFSASFASGSSDYNTMIVCPCSMGTLGRIANGISGNLITRAADVILKERRKLILVTRETPLNMIHINNMKIVTEAGGIICPANPSFYSKPQTIEELAITVIDRVLTIAGFNFEKFQYNTLINKKGNN